MYTVGCGSIWIFRKARLNSAHRENRKIWLRTIVWTDVLYHPYQVYAQSDDHCRRWIDSKILKMRASTAALEGKRKIWLLAIVRTDVWYHPTKFRLNKLRTVGCELIWRFKEARPLWGIEKSDVERLCGLMSCIITKFQLIRIRNIGCESVWRLKRRASTARPWSKSKNPAPSDCAGWCLVSSY